MDCVEQSTCKKAETPHLHEAIHNAWGKPKPKSDDVNSQAQQSADTIFSALPKGNRVKGLSPLKANVIWDTLYGKSADEIAAIDKAFTEKYGRLDPKTRQRFGMMDTLYHNMPDEQYKEVSNLVAEKNKNDVPVDKRVDGEQLITDTSKLHVGLNHMTTPDGRSWDLYVPKNAQKPLPLIIAMHGMQGNPNDSSVMERESGGDLLAEQKGVAIAYLEPKFRKAPAAFGLTTTDVGAWNMKGAKNLLPTDESYDDKTYLDQVREQVSQLLPIDKKRIGLWGMSDGARFAQDVARAEPGVYNAVVSFEGTYMSGDPIKTKQGENVMVVHGTSDYVLPYYQTGWFSRGPLSVAASVMVPDIDTTSSRPYKQAKYWKEIDGATEPAKRSDDGVVETSTWKGPGGVVEERLIKSGQHAISDWRNFYGGMFLGNPDRNLNLSEDAVDFILDHPS